MGLIKDTDQGHQHPGIREERNDDDEIDSDEDCRWRSVATHPRGRVSGYCVEHARP
jgi:hypothetical protein